MGVPYSLPRRQETSVILLHTPRMTTSRRNGGGALLTAKKAGDISNTVIHSQNDYQ